ncbi:MAG: hypothetical protein ABIL62_05705 [Planctomycetota bacterium]
MHISLTFIAQHYNLVRAYLFKGKHEQGCFLFVDSSNDGSSITLRIKEIHFIGSDGWNFQSGYHLELNEEEKVRVMQKARELNCHLIECHSHRFGGIASFSPSDIKGLGEFVQYIWWKLPNKIYGAVVFTKNDLQGQIWLPKDEAPKRIAEITVVDKNHNIWVVNKEISRRPFYDILKRWRHE